MLLACLQADVAAGSDWDEFAEFQSCPPPPAPAALLGSPPPPRATDGALPSSWFASNITDCLVPTEDAPAAAHTPVQAVLPAAKPTRFRQGLVPPIGGPDKDGLAAIEPLVSVEGARFSGDRRRDLIPEHLLLCTSDNSGPVSVSGLDSRALAHNTIIPAMADAQPSSSAAVGTGTSDLLQLATPALLPPPGVSPTLSGSASAPLPNPDVLTGSQDAVMGDFSARLTPAQLGADSLAVATRPAETVDEEFGEFMSVARLGASRHGSLPSLDLQVAPSADAGEVSPLEPDRRDTDAEPPAARPDRYDSFRQQAVSRIHTKQNTYPC